MGFEKIDILTSTVVATQVENIDTDQIIPARFLKATKREGFGEAMFRDWRYTSEGKVIEDSVFAKADKNARGSTMHHIKIMSFLKTNPVSPPPETIPQRQGAS